MAGLRRHHPLGRCQVRSRETAMNSSIDRVLLIVGGAAALGAAIGYFGQCSSGACPLTSTWWRGALYGAAIGFLVAFGSRTP